ncbi:hypothetical protein ASG43_13840 [Aureimonas sp. Leaf454]|uniref:GNAT family N-acetyltransferase n=1 Tax=Aureimonas sp. Leaf454 TaxID=1736381 RepID=UPI0006F7CBD4|nr:GNAT family N-acetyltransferase [Aureimonas sp. Leaf454]KQT44428.1 hypothetical protein ASG43_13840 [Aureimonas sp. Leaf454]
MSAKPLADELMASPSAAPAMAFVQSATETGLPDASVSLLREDGVRRVSIYAPRAAFSLVDELDFLTRRAIDHNVFFAPQFLIPAMPRLDDRTVRLFVMRDEGARRSRVRLLMPFSVERAGLIAGPTVIRAWTHPFGPLGTPLVDSDDPAGTLISCLETMSAPALGLPGLVVFPDLRLDGAFARTLIAAAEKLRLPMASANTFDRASLDATAKQSVTSALSSKRRREIQRQRRLLEAKGEVVFETARETTAVRHALEDFLTLEASGWKGRSRSALVMDRYKAAFTRESVNRLAEKDRTRIFTLRLDGAPVASLVAFVVGGEAFAWKMAYDESHAAASPGLQMMIEASDALIADPDVLRADSCAVPDHFLMNRLWKDRLTIGTLVVGLSPDVGRRVDQAAEGLERMRRSRNMARLMRERLKSMLKIG